MGKTVGQGAYGRVCIAKDKVSGNVVAIKLVSKEQIQQLGKMRHVFREKDLLFELKSQYVIELLATTMDDEYLYFIFENCENGDLAGLISA